MLPVSQLHVLLGETKRYFEFLEKIDTDLASQWLAKCNVMRERFHGGSIRGNDCRKLMQSTGVLLSLLPKRHQTQARSQHKPGKRKPGKTFRYEVMHELIKVVACFNVVVSQTMALRVHPTGARRSKRSDTSSMFFLENIAFCSQPKIPVGR